MSNPVINAEINENIPTIGVNVPEGNVPVLPIESIGDTPVEPVIESITITENGTYNVPEGVDGYNPVRVNVPVTPIPGTVIDNADMVKNIPVPVEPDVLPEGMLYMIPKGHQYCPPIPEVTGSPYAIICCNDVVTQGDSWVNHDRLVASTKFWLFMNPNPAKCRRDQIRTLSWGDSTGNAPPLHVYVYDTSSPNFQWVELDTTDAQFIADFNKSVTDTGAIIHNTLELCYTNYNIFRYTVGNLEYDMALSTLNEYGREIDPYYIDEFDCYLVDNTHTAVYQNTYTLKELISAYR